MRKLAALICLFTLAACGQPTAPHGPTGELRTAASAADGDSVMLATTRNTCRIGCWWLRQRDAVAKAARCLGQVHSTSAQSRAETALANIWVQVRYGQPASVGRERRNDRRAQLSATTSSACTIASIATTKRRSRSSSVRSWAANEEVVARDQPQQVYRAAPQTRRRAHHAAGGLPRRLALIVAVADAGR
jgi:hypothetical protein